MPPGRPREFDADQALDAAMRLFWHRGYRATTTRDLVLALGLGQSSITSAFGTKVDLADAALARYLGRLERELVGPLRDAADGLAAIDRFLAELTDWHMAEGGRGCLVGRLMCEGAHSEPRIAQRVAEYRVVLRGAIDAALERAAEAGEIQAGALEARRNLVVAVVLALNLAMQAGYDPEAQRALVDAGREQVASWGAQTAAGSRGSAAGRSSGSTSTR